MRPPTVVLLAACLLLFVCSFSDACEMEQTHRGCKLQDGFCSCGFGCKSEYRYSSMAECQNVLKEKSGVLNICTRFPCQNRGTCIQISQKPGYKCRCDGTGFYGHRCEKVCPIGGFGKIIPYECVVI